MMIVLVTLGFYTSLNKQVNNQMTAIYCSDLTEVVAPTMRQNEIGSPTALQFMGRKITV